MQNPAQGHYWQEQLAMRIGIAILFSFLLTLASSDATIAANRGSM
jgi:hypothetical protein